MSLACEPNKPTPTYLERLTQKIKRDLGLSPVFNVSTVVTPCIEKFVSPSYDCGVGMCEPTTGLTIGCPFGYTLTSGDTLCVSGVTTATTITVNPPCLHNLSEVGDFDITFNFSGGSTMYTGYTGEFCYSTLNTLPAKTIPSVCIPYSGVTGNSVTRKYTVNLDISSVDNEYIVRSWDKFTSRCMTNNLGSTGITIDTSPYIDSGDDCYFVTTVNPPTPTFQYIPFELFQNISFINESLGALTSLDDDGNEIIENSNVFQLTASPVGGQVVLSVNGITVDTSQYTVDQSTRIVTLDGGVTLESRDVIQAYYNKTILTDASAVALDDVVRLEVFSVTGITTGVTSSVTATTYSNIVNYNNVNNRTEIFLTEKIDPSVEPVMTINGVNVVYNIDFFKSNSVDNKLILAEGSIIESGDIISIYYYYTGHNNAGDLGTLRTDKPTIQWYVPQNVMKTLLSNGSFIVEIADRNDPTYTNILKSMSTIYNNTTSDYTLEVGPITTYSVKDYIYRVRFIKNYVTQIVNNVYETESYSKSGSFKLNWAFIKNTNF